MSALLEAWPESPTSIGQNAGQDNGSDIRLAWTGLFFTTMPAIILPVAPNPLSGFDFI
ncbi:hypothetical protein AWB69_01615 [Caballeronia udeis]|uniref:Uncharacterized protein n=1 Tax=Caballeronia udeis TaxID=1232866 RepID=A0A158FUB6_9BURK|nr:hypothetical protein [Caballeronia udeis]SAL23201.1 hypothetical protein AWB69_01615 [Caballeronia udeis]